MAKFYRLNIPGDAARYYITATEARQALALATAKRQNVQNLGPTDTLKKSDLEEKIDIDISAYAGSMRKKSALDIEGASMNGRSMSIDEVDVDELDVRSMAAQWLNLKAKNQYNALKREASKTSQQRSDNMRKAWETRRKRLGH